MNSVELPTAPKLFDALNTQFESPPEPEMLRLWDEVERDIARPVEPPITPTPVAAARPAPRPPVARYSYD